MSLDHRRSLFASEAKESSGSLRSEAMDMSSVGVGCFSIERDGTEACEGVREGSSTIGSSYVTVDSV